MYVTDLFLTDYSTKDYINLSPGEYEKVIYTIILIDVSIFKNKLDNSVSKIVRYRTIGELIYNYKMFLNFLFFILFIFYFFNLNNTDF